MQTRRFIYGQDIFATSLVGVETAAGAYARHGIPGKREGDALAAEPPTRLLKRMSPLSVYGVGLVIGHGPTRLLGMTRIFS
jgi:hypothetical protein